MSQRLEPGILVDRDEESEEAIGGVMETATAERLKNWLASARSGSLEAEGQLPEGCRQYLLLIANQELDEALAVKIAPSDLVQETLLRAHKNFPRFEGRDEIALQGWLRRILLNAITDAGRHFQGAEKRDLTREIPLATSGSSAPYAAHDESPSSLAVVFEQDALLQRALGQLTHEHRQIIHWRNYERLRFEEIGPKLGRSADAAQKLWTRALAKLQELLEPDLGSTFR